MSFLNNGNANSRMAPKGPPNDARGARPERDATDSPFGSDLLHDTEPESMPRVASPYATERPPAFGAPPAAPNSGPTPAEKCTNVIAAGAKWQGTLNVEDSVRIDGTFTGEIDAKGTLHVAEGAQVDAKVRASYVVISGEFRGEIRCEQRVDLMPRSRVSGEVITKILSVHEGATLDGNVKMSNGTDIDARRTAARIGRTNGAEASEAAVAASAERRAERVPSVPNGVSGANGRNGSTPSDI